MGAGSFSPAAVAMPQESLCGSSIAGQAAAFQAAYLSKQKELLPGPAKLAGRSPPVEESRRVRKQNLEYLLKAHRRLQSCIRRMARAELLTKERLWFGELPDSPSSLSDHHNPTKVTKTTSIMEPFLIEPTNVYNCPRSLKEAEIGVCISGRRIASINGWTYERETVHTEEEWQEITECTT